jgi:hypothetical protein
MYITDPQGNRANIAYWGGEENARASLATLTDCTRCTRCTDCMDCTRCTRCDLTRTHHRLPVSDPRGFMWIAFAEMGSWHIHAGCHDFSIAEARAHWLGSDYGGPDDVRETVGHALDWIAGKPAA